MMVSDDFEDVDVDHYAMHSWLMVLDDFVDSGV